MTTDRPAAGIAMTDDDVALMRLVDTATFIRGRTYAKTGSVLSATWDEARRAVHGEVEGSSTLPYRVTAHIRRGGDGRLATFTSSCSCPVGNDCKHGVAVLLHGLAALESQQRKGAAWQASLSGLLEPDVASVDIEAPTIAVLVELVEFPAGGRRIQRRIAAGVAAGSRPRCRGSRCRRRGGLAASRGTTGSSCCASLPRSTWAR